MTLTDLIAEHPNLFYKQEWYSGESFMQRVPRATAPKRPPTLVMIGPVSSIDINLPSAVELAEQYVNHPNDGIWAGWLWTRDTDRYGQRIYIGNVNGKGLEIHRHLAITERWGVPSWG